MNNERIAKKHLLRRSQESKGVTVKGYDFNDGVDFSKLIDSFGSTGFQATHLNKAIAITNEFG
jgi:deoxyhypusine synthase